MRTKRIPKRTTGWVLVLLCHAIPVTAQIDQLPHPDTTSGNFFGVAVAIDGTRALVGASGEHSCLEDGGAAYLFELDLNTRRWHRVARLLAGDCHQRRFFGRSVALSSSRALVAASNEENFRRDPDMAYVFERDTSGSWQQTATLTTGSVYEDGTTGTVVALEDNYAILTTWGETSTGSYGGAAYVFEYDDATKQWNHAARLTGSGGVRHGVFGGNASMDGNRLVVPSSRYLQNRPGSAYIFEHDLTGAWEEVAHIQALDDFFISVDIDRNRLLVGESRSGNSGSGEATLFAPDSTGAWQLLARLSPPTPYKHGAFGSKVALSGDRALVTGFDEQLKLNINIDRVVYVYAYDQSTETWGYQSIIDIGHAAFGSAIDLDGHFALIGASSENVPGAAYIVRIP